ncbi:MAG: 50S ribosomal protein L25 [Bacillota bacterium]
MKLAVRTEPIRKVREAKLVPGVMFGKSIESVSIQVDEKELKDALKTYGKSMTFKAELDGITHHVYIQHVETKILKPRDIIHFDLHRVDEKVTLVTLVPIVFLGKAIFNSTSLYTQEEMHELHVEAMPGHGVAKIEVDVSKMQLGEEILVKDLVLSSEIKIKEDPERVIVALKEINIVEEETDIEEESTIELAEEPADEK